MKKNCKVVMLPTEKASNLFIGKTYKKLHFNNQTPDEDCKDYQHIYLISDEEVKEGDWCVVGDSICQFNPEITSQEEVEAQWDKIIATTDKSLEIKIGGSIYDEGGATFRKLPQIPDSFIKAYIKAYNEGNPIEEVQVEYEIVTMDRDSDIWRLKTREDNTIIIHRAKTYTREEVVKLIKDAVAESKTAYSSLDRIGLENWIEENL